jgi:hypothetical protein
VTEADILEEILREQLGRLADGRRAVRNLGLAQLGNVEVARSLVYALPSKLRGDLAVVLYFTAPVAAFRAALRAAWIHDHAYVVHAVGSAAIVGERPRSRLYAMFRRAKFPLPDGLPPVVRIWRGAPGGLPRDAARGVSWTLNRDTACWFALWPRHIGLSVRGPAFVLTAEVPRSSLLFHNDARGEQEVVCFGAHRTASVDEGEDWRAGFKRQIEANLRLQAEREQAAADDPDITLYPPPPAAPQTPTPDGSAR